MCFARIVELQPEAGAAHYSIGLHLQALGRGEEALAAYTKAIEVAPKETDAYVNRGRLRDESGDPAISRKMGLMTPVAVLFFAFSVSFAGIDEF